MVTFLIVMAIIASHFVVGGFSYSKIQSKYRPLCEQHYCDSDCGHSVAAGISVVLWPVILPIMLGNAIGNSSGTSRAEKRQAKEIAQAKHEAELARIKRIAVEELDRELAIATRK